MDIRQLEYFAAVAAEKNFSRAAEKQFVAQTTISYHISLLEKELGVQLLERGNKKVELTPAGIEFFDRTQQILKELDRAKEAARLIHHSKEEYLRIGYFGHSCFKEMPHVLEELTREHPNLVLDVCQKKQSELIRMLEKNEIDCMLCTDYGMFNQITWMNKMCLYADPIRLLARADHWAAARSSISIHELEGERFALLVEKKLWDQEKNFPLKNVHIHYMETHDDLLMMVRSGYALSMGAEHALDNGDPDLRLIPFVDYTVYDNNYLCWKEERRKPVLNDFIRIMNCTVNP